MFSQEKKVSHNKPEHRLRKYAVRCNDSSQDDNISILCHAFLHFKEQFRGSDIQMIAVEQAISDAIFDYSPRPILDISSLNSSFKGILLRELPLALRNFLEKITLQLDEIKQSTLYDVYNQEKLTDLIDSITQKLELARDPNSFEEEISRRLLRCYQSLNDRMMIENSLVTRKFMLSIGQEIDTVLEKTAEYKYSHFFNYYRSKLACCLSKILDEYKAVCYSSAQNPLHELLELIPDNTFNMYLICQSIIEYFVRTHPLSENESSLKRVSVYVLKKFQEKSLYKPEDQELIEAIMEVIADCIIRYSINHITYYPGISLFSALKNISYLDKNGIILEKIRFQSIIIPVLDPFDYKDYFSQEYQNNQALQTEYSFRTDFDRIPYKTILSGQFLSEEIKEYEQNNYKNFLRNKLFQKISDPDMQDALIDLFCRHTNQVALSHLSMSFFPTYLTTIHHSEYLAEIISHIEKEEVHISFYPIENGYGVVQKNRLVYYRSSDPDRTLIYLGTLAIAHELTLNSPDPDNVRIRCISLDYLEDNTDASIIDDELIIDFLEILKLKSYCIPYWQNVDTDILFFAYGLTINQKKDILGFEFQIIAKRFCEVLRKNYNSLSPNKKKKDQMALGLSIKKMISDYSKKNTQDFIYQIENVKEQLQDFEELLFSEEIFFRSTLFSELPYHETNELNHVSNESHHV